MNPLKSEQQALEHERSEILQQLEDWLDLPMLVLSFIWLALFAIELTSGNPLLEGVSFSSGSIRLKMWAFRTVKNALGNTLSDRVTHIFKRVVPAGWAVPTDHFEPK